MRGHVGYHILNGGIDRNVCGFGSMKPAPTSLNSQVQQSLLNIIKLNPVANISILMVEKQHVQNVRNAPTIFQGVK